MKSTKYNYNFTNNKLYTIINYLKNQRSKIEDLELSIKIQKDYKILEYFIIN